MALAMVLLAAPATSQEVSLHELAARGEPGRLAQAIADGADVDQRDEEGQTPLHVAAETAHLHAVMMLVAKGADPNARDRNKRTPLHLAADGDARSEGERFQIVKLLLAKGGDRTAVDAQGKRPLDYARAPEFKDELAPPDAR